METPDQQKRPRRALVTGGASGIGWAICQTLAARGYQIVLADIDAQASAKQVAALGPGHHALSVDLCAPDAATNLPDRAAQMLGGLDVIVNNAGMTDSSGKPLTDLPEATFNQLVALNLTAVSEICAAAPQVLGPGACIVNLASGASYRPLALRGPYSATKAGVTALTEVLARDYAPFGIAVSAIAPGYTLTPLVQKLADEGRVNLDAVSASIPLGRIALPEDIASVAAFCAGAGGFALSSETLVVDGGGLMGPPTAGTAPSAGTRSTGVVAVLGATDGLKTTLPEGFTTVASIGEIAALPALAGVIDIAPVKDVQNATDLLAHTRAVALACAANTSRTDAFALLFAHMQDDSVRGAAACAARAMLARTLALEWAAAGLRVNALTWRGDLKNQFLALAGFLTGPEAGFITGQVIQGGKFA